MAGVFQIHGHIYIPPSVHSSKFCVHTSLISDGLCRF